VLREGSKILRKGSGMERKGYFDESLQMSGVGKNRICKLKSVARSGYVATDVLCVGSILAVDGF